MRRRCVSFPATLAAGAHAVAAAPAASAADIPANRSTRAVITLGPARFHGTFERGRDSDWYRVTLRGVRIYAFEAFS